MKIRSFGFPILVAVLAGFPTAVAGPKPSATFKLPSVGGWVMTTDNITLIVSVPSKGELVYFDTVNDKEAKRVEVDFQPTALALQGQTLFAASKGSSEIYALDLKSGKEIKKFKLPGEPVFHITCHPTTGLICASNDQQKVFSIDVPKGKVQKTEARGMFLAIDPVKGNTLFTGSIKPPEERIVVRGGANGSTIITFEVSGDRAKLLKYSISGETLKLIDGSDNAAIGASGTMHLSPDGKSIAFIAGGGWRSKTDESKHVEIAIFDTSDLRTMRGAVDVGAPQNLIFHPVLKVGVGLGNNVDLHFFNPKSLVIRKKESLERMPHTFWFNLLDFGAQGTKLIYLQGENLLFVPLELSAEDRALLKGHYANQKK